MQAMWGYIADGLFNTEDEIKHSADQSGLGSTPMPGDIKYRDLNGDGIINSHDKCMISEYGKRPRIQYGLGVNVMYKNFDFGAFINGSAMRKVMISGIHPFLSGTLSTSGDKMYSNSLRKIFGRKKIEMPLILVWGYCRAKLREIMCPVLSGYVMETFYA